MPTEHQLLVTVLAYRKDCGRWFRYEVSCPGLAMERISVLRKYLFYGTFCNHPEKGGKMSQKQSTSACTHIRIHSEIGKENKLAFRKSYNLLICTINPPKRMK